MDSVSSWPTIDNLFDQMSDEVINNPDVFSKDSSSEGRGAAPAFDEKYGHPISYYIDKTGNDCDSYNVSLDFVQPLDGRINDYCDEPVPLYGDYDPKAPGYIVILNEGIDVNEEIDRLTNLYGIEFKSLFDGEGVKAIYAEMNSSVREALRCESSIKYIEHDFTMKVLR